MDSKVYSREKWCFPPEKKIPDFSDSVNIPTDELLREVFAPDPLTGNPTSDLRLLIHGENNELNEYIRTHLMTPVSGSKLLGASDSDGEAALDSLPRLEDSDESYFARLRELASGSSQSVEAK